MRNSAQVRLGLRGATTILALILSAGCGHTSAGQQGAPAGGVQCGPRPSSPPVANPNLPDLPGQLTVQSTLRDHFGDRFAMVWVTTPHQSDGSDRRVVVAVVSPSDDDRAFVRSIPDIGGRIVVVASKYSAAQLDQFQSDLSPLISSPSASSSGSPIVVSTSTGVRDDNFTQTATPVVAVGVTACDPALIERITAVVPTDVLQLQIEEPIRNVSN
jgi:hypothetical protein